VELSVTRESQGQTLSVLRRFVQGEATVAELTEAAEQAGLRVNCGGGLLDDLRLSRAQLATITVGAGDLTRQISRHLAGHLTRSELFDWVTFLHSLVTAPAYEDAMVSVASVATTLRLLGFLLDEHYPAPYYKLRGSLVHMRRCLEHRGLRAVRELHPRVLRDMGTLRFSILEPPAICGAALACPRGQTQWLDVGLLHRPREPVRLIPLSVFTRRFFYDDMPHFIDCMCVAEADEPSPVRGDRFYYHPENDQAIELRERFPQLAAWGPRFQYFIDESGLAELVIDSANLGRGEMCFAIKAFCLLNGVRRATLNGRSVPTAPAAW
jgi:hypothetical protein